MNLRVHLCCGCLVISILFLEKTTTFAQPINNVETLNSDKGLSQNSVYSICKDSKGFLWIGTGDGLNRYDGKEFVVIRNATSKSRSGLKGFSINYSMGKDNRNNLWFSTERNLVKFNLPLQTFSEIIPFNDSLHGQGNKTITHIDTTENTIWFITPGECLVSYNYSKETFHKYSFPFLDPKKNLFLNPSSVDDRHGKIWLTCREGLFAFDKKKTFLETIL